MNAGILGSGDAGRKLGDGLIEIGHRSNWERAILSKESVRKWAERHGEKASAGSPGDSAIYGEFIVRATNWSGTETPRWNISS
ncbi:MAG TPA: hypothetical protein VL087_02660 [Nitrospirota bacterium]|nr:hypothetical protein [Nitrospirota bacterium]